MPEFRAVGWLRPASASKSVDRSWLLISFCLTLIGGFGCTSIATDELACSQSGVYGGTAVNDDPRFGAVGYLRTVESSNGSEERGLCTVTRIARGKAITAAHCTSSNPSWQGRVGFASDFTSVVGPCGSTSNDEQLVVDVWRNLALDLALLHFQDSGEDTIPLLEVLPPAGSEVVAIGYGVTETGSYGQKRFASSVVASVSAQTITISSAGESGACVGDSGGPLLLPSTESGFKAGGFLSAGSADCHGTDLYTPSVVALAWLSDLDEWKQR